MVTLNVSITDSEYKRFGIKSNQLSFSDLIDILKRELAKEPQIREHDTIVNNVPIKDIPMGSMGTVVHAYPNGDAFEVEYIVSGKSIVETSLRNQIDKSKDASTQ